MNWRHRLISTLAGAFLLASGAAHPADARSASAIGGFATEEQGNVGRFWGDQPLLQWNPAWRQIG